jgi:hypothetical protein
MFRLVTFTLLAAFVASAAPVPKGSEKRFYFPLTVGAKWVMEQKAEDTVRTTTQTVIKVEGKDGKYLVTVERENAPVTRAVEVFEVTDEGVSRVSQGVVESKEPVPLLKLGVKVGDKWEVEEVVAIGPRGPDGSPRSITAKVTYTAGNEEEVEVPVGKFKAMKVEREFTRRGLTTKSTTWYAARVGVVKTESSMADRKLIAALKEFMPGKQ